MDSSGLHAEYPRMKRHRQVRMSLFVGISYSHNLLGRNQKGLDQAGGMYVSRS